MNNPSKKNIKKELFAIATSLIILIFIFNYFPAFVESYYSNMAFPLLSSALHIVFNYIPISVGDLMYIIIICLILIGVLKFLKLLFHKNFAEIIALALRSILILEVAIIIFYAFWGINYFREPALKRFNLPRIAYSTAELKTVLNLLIDSTNACRSKLKPQDFSVKDAEIFNSAIDDIKQAQIFKNQINIGIKPSLLSGFLNYSATAGYYNPFTAEAQINKDIPVFLKPFVSLHELSHQLGVGPEDEANFTGFLSGISSKSNLTRYSAYYLATQEFLYDFRKRDSIGFQQAKSRLSASVLKDFETEKMYWLKYRGRLERMTGFFYDKFLKVNNQPEGIRTYNRMIYLTMYYYHKKYDF